MFIGHFAVGLASKRVAAKASLDTATIHVPRIGFASLDTISKRRLADLNPAPVELQSNEFVVFSAEGTVSG